MACTTLPHSRGYLVVHPSMCILVISHKPSHLTNWREPTHHDETAELTMKYSSRVSLCIGSASIWVFGRSPPRKVLEGMVVQNLSMCPGFVGVVASGFALRKSRVVPGVSRTLRQICVGLWVVYHYSLSMANCSLLVHWPILSLLQNLFYRLLVINSCWSIDDQ